MPETEKRVMLANHPFVPSEACRASSDGLSGLDFQPGGVEAAVSDKPKLTRVARRRFQKESEANATAGVPRLRMTRFLREVAVMKIERLEKSRTKTKRKFRVGPMFGDEEIVPLKKPGTTAGLARRTTQAKIRSWLPESLDSPMPVAPSGCATTCSENGCAEKCQCRKNGIKCFGEAGCLCKAHNCSNKRRPEIYGEAVHKDLSVLAITRQKHHKPSGDTYIKFTNIKISSGKFIFAGANSAYANHPTSCCSACNYFVLLDYSFHFVTLIMSLPHLILVVISKMFLFAEPS